MNIYHYHPVSGEFLGSGMAEKSPLEVNVFLIPSYATSIAPPSTAANEVAVFAALAWSVVPDFRGQTAYDKTTGVASVVASIGALPVNQSLTKTAVQLLSSAQTAQLSVLSSSCSAQIYAGFSSSALGAAYTYPANDKDQSNLVASVTASLVPGLPVGWTTNFWCVDAAGVWAFRPHTAAQIQKAGLDGKAAIETALQKNGTLANQVSAITVATPNAVATVQAIVW